MTPAQVAALTVGSTVTDSAGATAQVTFTRDRSSTVEVNGVIELEWTSAPHTGRISVFNYDDPCFQRFT